MNKFFVFAACLLFSFFIYPAFPIIPEKDQPVLPHQYVDKFGRFYTLKPCECVDGMPPNNCGYLFPMTASDTLNKPAQTYKNEQTGAEIWIQNLPAYDWERGCDYDLYQLVKNK